MRSPQRWTIRTRITLLTASLVFLAGSVLVAGGYWWLTMRLPDAALQVTDGRVGVAIGEGLGVELPGAAMVIGRTPTLNGESGAVADAAGDQQVVDLVTEAVQATSNQLTSEVARRAAIQSAVLLMLLTGMALAVGWFAARRALKPIHELTESARRLGGSTLTERLEVDGPRDEVRELGETLNDLLDRVEGSLRREQRLLANVSHELRTPLANQRAVLELALEDPEADSLHSAASTALEQNVRANRLIEQLLLLARVEQSPIARRDADVVDLSGTVRSVASAPALAALATGVRLTVEAPGTVEVTGDSILLERLVGNLLENAVNHNVPEGWVRVEVGESQGRAHVIVENSGPLVADAEIESLRQPFRRGAKGEAVDRIMSGEGSGLGLSVVDSIARRYSIDTSMQPRHDGGLTVALTWPRHSTGPPAV